MTFQVYPFDLKCIYEMTDSAKLRLSSENCLWSLLINLGQGLASF